MRPTDLRAIIVDDEAPCRELLQDLLTHHPNVRVIGEAISIATAAALCADLRPNLIFLDVQMADGEGFDLLPRLDPVPAVIFVTGYNQYAFRAFEVNAVDYLAKPVSADRLAHAIQRIVHQPQSAHTVPLLENDRIFLRSDSQAQFVFVSEISGVEAVENYSRVHLVNGTTKMIRRGMSDWERVLPPKTFLRAHRSLIVNLRAVNKVVMESRYEIDVDIAGFPHPVRLGRRGALRLRQALRRPNLL